MSFHFTQPWWLGALLVGAVWVIWLWRRSQAQLSLWRRCLVLGLRLIILASMVLALAGAQWLRPQEGLNVFFVLDRSDSIPASQQEASREWVQKAVDSKESTDKAGVVVFGTQASIERTASPVLNLQKLFAVVDTQRTDLGSAIRLATAAFPENGQRRLVILSDGNENLGDAVAAVEAARPLGVSIDVLPLGVSRSGDASIQKFTMPSQMKKGQTFEVKVFTESDRATKGMLRLFRDDALLGEQEVELSAGKNLFTFAQTLPAAAFYRYDARLDVAGDVVPQNNRATAFANVRGDPRVLMVCSNPAEDGALVAALRESKLDVRIVRPPEFPTELAEIQSFDSIFLINVSGGDLGDTLMKLLESAVRDFGIGVVCVGGDQSFAAGAYRGTPLESLLPVDMDLSSKKVLPNGAMAMIMHGMEFMNGNQIARQTALGVLDALGPQDELGIVLWDGFEKWLFPMTKVGDRKSLGRMIASMNQGDLPSFKNVMSMAHEGLRKSTANLRHILVFSDGDPGPPPAELMEEIVQDRITVSTVLIAGHSGPETMQEMAQQGRGRFYHVENPAQLPQVFIKETAVVLKSAIFEEPFQPKLAASSEVVRGISSQDYPILRGYVAANPKARAEVPLVTDKGDPLLAHWQHGLGRTVAFTSDAKPRWASDWVRWPQYRQFWSQIAQWSLRRVDNTDLDARISLEGGEGVVTVEALDSGGDYRNFLNLQAVVVSPSGERQSFRLSQTGPGRYEVRFPTKQIGGYLVNLMELQEGKVRGSMILGASVNYSPEFANTQPNWRFLKRLADLGRGRELSPLNPSAGPFSHDRQRTFQSNERWEFFLKLAIVLFPLDVAVRRVQLEGEEWRRLAYRMRRLLGFRALVDGREADESLAALLARRDAVRSTRPMAISPDAIEGFHHQAPSDRGLGATGSGDQGLRAGVAEMPQAKSRAGGGVGEPGGGAAAGDANLPTEESTTSRLLEAQRKARKKGLQ